MNNRRIVFTKPWKQMDCDRLADLVGSLGFNGVELPVRTEYQVTPDTVVEALPKAAACFAEHGMSIISVAADPTPEIITACGESGVEMIRTMVPINMELGYRRCVEEARDLYSSLTPLLQKHGVKLGVQNHCDYYIGSAAGLMDLIDPLDTTTIGAVLDLAHCALDGEPVDMAIDIVFDRLFLANFKSAYRRRINGTNADEAKYEIYWCTAGDATYSWRNAATILRNRGYDGALCIPAEYSVEDGGSFLEEDDVIPYVKTDLAYLDTIFQR